MAPSPFVLAAVPDTLVWRRLCAGVYETLDGRVTLYRLEDVNPPAWNVEWTIDYGNAIADAVGGLAHTDPLLACIVDGAATFRDAKLLAADAWPPLRTRLSEIEEGGS